MAVSDKLPTLPFDTFGAKLDDLLKFTANKLEREWLASASPHPYSQTVLLSLILVSANTYRTMLYLCADKPRDSKPKPEYSLSASPLARTILDALFTELFLLEDLPARTEWFHKSGWREVVEGSRKSRAEHGDNPNWLPYIEGLEEFAESSKVELGITPDEAANPSKIKWWPIPNQMIPKVSDPLLRTFMQYLSDWFYREFSQDSHLSFRGLARRSGYLLLDRKPEQASWDIAKQKSDVLGTTVVFLLSMMSEIEIRFRYGATARLSFIWQLLAPFFQQAQEIYDFRYSARL